MTAIFRIRVKNSKPIICAKFQVKILTGTLFSRQPINLSNWDISKIGQNLKFWTDCPMIAIFSIRFKNSKPNICAKFQVKILKGTLFSRQPINLSNWNISKIGQNLKFWTDCPMSRVKTRTLCDASSIRDLVWRLLYYEPCMTLLLVGTLCDASLSYVKIW